MGNTPPPPRVVSIKLEHDLDEKLTEYARTRRVSRSAVVREALRAYTAPRKHSALDLAGNLVGSLSAPRDLSTNKQRLKGFGE